MNSGTGWVCSAKREYGFFCAARSVFGHVNVLLGLELAEVWWCL